ncbi:MAG TPA: Ig-like domain-containing protein [Gemmatimonadales bacterium]|jgi:uncharacterized protein YjdB
MRIIRSARALSALVILAAAGACSSESLGPATSGSRTVNVVPSLATIGEGQAVQLTAKLVDEFGDPLEATFTWSSSNTDVATVSVGGTVFGRRAGRAAIIASAHGRAQSAAVVVLRDESEGKPSKPRPPSTN